jgi:acetaldehyde dehydrogenase
MKKIKVAIIGTGNIGTDLLIKIQRSNFLECSAFIGRNKDSEGIKRAKELGIKTSFESIKFIEDNPHICDIVFDATSATVHSYNAPILKRLKKFTLDLTPSRVGEMCIPVINIDKCLDLDNVNMVTCGGQASVPIAYTIAKNCPNVEYIEVVASIASLSAGIGTRLNIDEYTQTTKDAISIFSGVARTKAIIVLNPAEPPILMHNTIYAKINNVKDVNLDLIRKKISEIANKIKEYVPGYNVVLEPIMKDDIITVMIKVTGLGDFLPKYAGNLDIITCASIKVAEDYAKKKLIGRE